MSRPLAQMFASPDTSTCRRVSTCIHGHVNIRTHQLLSSPLGHLLHINSWHLDSWHLDTSTPGTSTPRLIYIHLTVLKFRLDKCVSPTPSILWSDYTCSSSTTSTTGQPVTSTILRAQALPAGCSPSRLASCRPLPHCHDLGHSPHVTTSERANANANARTQH